MSFTVLALTISLHPADTGSSHGRVRHVAARKCNKIFVFLLVLLLQPLRLRTLFISEHSASRQCIPVSGFHYNEKWWRDL